MSKVLPFSTLGDGQFAELLYKSPNEFGVEIGYYTDIYGGAVPANIPNPPFVFQWPKNWGASTFNVPTETIPEIIIPWNPPQEQPPEAVIPEPSSIALMVLGVALMLWKHANTYHSTEEK